jgi:hypothetical protein
MAALVAEYTAVAASGTKASTEVRQQGRRHAHRAEHVGGHGRHRHRVINVAGGVVKGHDAGIVEQHIQPGKILGQLRRHRLDLLRVLDVQFHAVHARVGLGHLVQQGFAPAADDDLVAEPMKGFGDAAADAGCASGDEDGVAAGFHGVPCVE